MHFPEAYLEPCETSMMVFFAIIFNSIYPLSILCQKTTLEICERILNTPLLSPIFLFTVRKYEYSKQVKSRLEFVFDVVFVVTSIR